MMSATADVTVMLDENEIFCRS